MPISKSVLEKYRSEVFIETGSYLGDTIQMAQQLGFGLIYSIEASRELYLDCKERFKLDKNVILFCAESVKILPDIAPFVTDYKNITFWLDAHYSLGKTYNSDPLLEELRIILSVFKRGTILI